ncbi:hypothetical protein ACIRG4_08605 [Streptomyces sp. NPDC102395]|uniref:hypothetical protein n=1 Tax=Streptomyces sp. NPDC102395 TaxID=3366168 RepID=UPI003820AFA5
MKPWVRVIRTNVTVTFRDCNAEAIGGDPWGSGRHPLLWALVAAILGGVASGAAEKAAAVLIGSS